MGKANKEIHAENNQGKNKLRAENNKKKDRILQTNKDINIKKKKKTEKITKKWRVMLFPLNSKMP